MQLTLERVEAMAPDQSSLAAARKLFKPTIWPTLAEGEGLVWGECQGSGATPYRIVVHEGDAGYKCTCPSRKFPCKHVLALMWMRAEGKAAFAPSAVPDWVKDWLSRRRGPTKDGGKEERDEAPKARPSIHLAEIAETTPQLGVQAEARSAAARERNRLERETAVLAGLEQLDTWLSDQIERGMVSFLLQCTQACRTIAQRLVDAKAPGLASRLDALPTLLFTMPEPQRPYAAVRELGQIHLISKAYRRAAELDEFLNADARQTVGWSVTRESLLLDSGAVRVRGTWRVVAVVIESQPDRLRRVETWLWRNGVSDEAPKSAVLIDFVPVSTGAAASGYVVGDQLEAELVFYRSSVHLRAQIVAASQGAQPCADALSLPKQTLDESYSEYERALARLPWLGTFPLCFTKADVRRKDEQLYLCDGEHGMALPLPSSQHSDAMPLASVGPVDGIGLWNGYDFMLIWAETRLGRWVRA